MTQSLASEPVRRMRSGAAAAVEAMNASLGKIDAPEPKGRACALIRAAPWLMGDPKD
jgi:hypothetical protein